MAMTAEELLAQHRKVLAAKRAVEDSDVLYGEGAYEGMPNVFFESALKKLHEEVNLMKAMMARATLEVLAEAKRLAREEK